MNLMLSNAGFPSVFSNFPGPWIDRDIFDFDSDLAPSRLGINFPTANVIETPKEFTLELAAPGLGRKDFNVEVENHTLTISAEKEEEKDEKEGEYSRREYSFNSFTRSFTLPDNVKEGNIDAKYEDGILRVSIPKAQETPVKPIRKVTVS